MLKINFSENNINKIQKEILQEIDFNSQKKNSEEVSIKVNLDHLKQQVKYIEGFINTAKSRTEIRTRWPQSLNRFPFILLKPLSSILLICLKLLFKDQREVNFNILATLQEFIKLAGNLLQQVGFMNTEIKQRFQTLASSVTNLEEKSEQKFQTLASSVTNLEEKSEQKFQTLASSVTNLEEKSEQKFQTLASSVTNLEEKSVTNAKKVEYLEQQINYLKSELNQQKRLVTNFLEEAKKRLSEPSEQKQLETFIEEESHLLDAFYVAFEDRFRGSREEIRDRQKLYLPYLVESKLDKENSLILDIGCGRGEWLELLQDKGYKAKGIDLNRVMVEQCCARNLDAIEGNAIAYIKSLPDASLRAITGFHIIEHIPFEVLIQLFDEALRVLQSGGLIIFETPNPSNVLVGSCNFYLDPTHRNPLPSEMIRFVAESRGLKSVKILNLNPVLDEEQLQKADLPKPLDRYFYGAQDYAVIGYKA